MFVSLIFSAHAQISTGNEIGKVNLDKDKISISRHFEEHLKIYGSILEPTRATQITIIITDPNGDVSSLTTVTTDVGYFETFKILNWESLRGTYSILVSSNNKIIGSLSFVVQESDEYPVNTQTPIPSTSVPDGTDVRISSGSSVPGCEETNSCYSPYQIRVGPGSTITWYNADSDAHTVTSGTFDGGPDGEFDSSLFMSGTTFANRFDRAGTYPYFCMVHPWMTGYVIVERGGIVSTPPSPIPTPAPRLSSTAPSPSTARVSIEQGSSVPGCEETNECFIPYEVRVAVGEEVTWSNYDTAAHTVTSGTAKDGPDGNFDSSLFMAGTTFSVKFDDSGTYPYFCMVHPWMTGAVVVGQGAPSAPNTQTPKQITHNTVLTLNLEKASSQDSIRVFPEYTDDSGDTLSFTVNGSDEFIKIYIDNQYVTSVKPNQWSHDIVVGYSSHNAYAISPEFTLTGSGDRYLSVKSNTQSIYLQSPTVSVSSGTQDQSIFIVLGIIAVIGIVVGVIVMKRKKLSTILGGSQTDDTQVWR